MSKLFDAITNKGLPERDIKNAARANFWIVAWTLILVVSSIYVKYEEGGSLVPSIIAFSAITLIGIGMILSYRKMLKALDEMERKIQLDALALSVGVTIVGFGSYSILEKAGLLPDLSASYVIACMGFTYMVGLIAGRVRYS
jgi:hypothetical protein